MLSENVVLEKAFSDHTKSGFLVPYQKSHFAFMISFSNRIRSGLLLYPMDLFITILPAVTEGLPISPRFTPYDLYRDESSAILQLVNK